MNSAVFIIIFVISLTSALKCCPDGQHLEEWKICSDNITKINLSCPGKAFLIKHEHEPFNVSENGHLIIHDVKTAHKDNFCVDHMRSEGSFSNVSVVCIMRPERLTDKVRPLFVFLALVSIFFMAITLVVYILIPELRDLQGKVLMIFISCLLISYSQLAFLQLALNIPKISCILSGYVLYIAFLTSFCWLNVVCFNIWRSIRFTNMITSDNVLLRYYFLWGFGVPIVMTVLTVIISHFPGTHKKPEMGINKCWFSDNLNNWYYFYIPLSFFLLLNIIFFFSSIYTLWSNYQNTSSANLKSLKFKCKLYMRLFLIMGLTWIFEVISFGLQDSSIDWLWVILDSVNCAQGIIVFLLLIVFRKRVRYCLARNKTCGINWPERWRQDKDEESETELPEEIHMTNAINE